MDATPIVGWAIAVIFGGIGVWRNRRLNCDLRAARAELNQLPQKLADLVREAISPPAGAAQADGNGEARPARVWWQDVTGDGERELLVEHGVGAHSAVLKVFGKIGPYSDFELLGEMFTDHGSFDVADVDGDDRVEVRAMPTDYDAWGEVPGAPPRCMANAPMIETIWRWSGDGFDATAGRRWDPLREPERPTWLRDATPS